MARLLYWLIYNIDLGPFGPPLLDFAVKAWLRAHHLRRFQRNLPWTMAPAWTLR